MSRIVSTIIAILAFVSVQLFALNQQQQRDIVQTLAYYSPTVPVYDLQVQKILIDCANEVVAKVQQEMEALSIGQTTADPAVISLYSIDSQQLINMLETTADYVIQYEPNADAEYINYQCSVYEAWGYKIMGQLNALHDIANNGNADGAMLVQGVITPVGGIY